MKKVVILIIALILTAQTIKAQTVVLDTNGVTIKYIGATVPSPRFVQASPRGTLEWFAIVDNNTKSNITSYAKNNQSGKTYFTPTGSSTPIPFNNIITTLVTDMSYMFYNATAFNQPIGSWDISNVTNMYYMFYITTAFNQSLGSWDVSKVSDMSYMFRGASAFNQPIASWDVGNVTTMQCMFVGAVTFNQPIGDWNVSNVTNMSEMFRADLAFNQDISSWIVSKVTDMGGMFNDATYFNQNISSWNVGNVNNMVALFNGATAFNQPIGSWDVSNVTNMQSMFYKATAFNQSIGAWNVSNVTNMSEMFNYAVGLSTANYDALLIGWSTISTNETPLKSNMLFDANASIYCNGLGARNYLINTYGWKITDSGLNCTGLSTEEFDTSILKLYPNPVISVLNVNVDSNFANQPYIISDALGKVILKGKLNEGDNSINVEQLSKGIYYLKAADKNASKFIKE